MEAQLVALHDQASTPARRANMETVGLGFCFEDLPLGRRFKTVGRTVTETDIVGFINTIGMTEVLFTNREFREHIAGYAGRLAPGSLVFCLAEGLLAQATMQGTGFAFLGMQLDIKGPTFAGDTIHVECEVTEARLSESRPGRGIVRTRNRVVKEDGTPVMEYTPLRMIKCRSGVAA
jgi:acyl dehydratase